MIVIAAQVLHNPGADFHVSPAAKKPVSARIRRNTEQFNSVQMLATPHFWVLYAAFVLTSVGGLMITAQASPVGKTLAIPAAAIVAALSWSRLANGAGRIFWGMFSDFVGREMAMVIPFLLQSLCLVGVLTLGKTFRRLVYHDDDPDLLHLGQHVRALPGNRRRLFRGQQRYIQLRLPLYRQGRRFHRRRRNSGDALYQVRELEYPGLLDRRVDRGFRFADPGAPLHAVAWPEKAGGTIIGYCQSGLIVRFRSPNLKAAAICCGLSY